MLTRIKGCFSGIRPTLLARVLAVLFVFGLASTTFSACLLADSTSDCPELVLYGGKIVTVDPHNVVARSVTIRYGRIAALGFRNGIPKHLLPCARTINLHEHTVIPGLIDNHNHFVVLSRRPGHDTRLETAESIADVKQIIYLKAKSLRAGEWITSIGGWNAIAQLLEKRLPNLTELDSAAPNNPVLISSGLFGPSSTNSLGKEFFESKQLFVTSNGFIAGSASGGENETLAAIDALRAMQTEADLKRAALDAINYSLSLGLTTHDDQGGGFPAANIGLPEFDRDPIWRDLVEVSNNSSSLDPFSGYKTLLMLDQEGQLPLRLRLFFYVKDLDSRLIFLRQRLDNAFPNFGDDYIKTTGMGEWIASGNLSHPSSLYEEAASLVARRGWSYNQHSQSLEDERAITSVWEKINTTIPIGPLRWCLAHVPGIDAETVNRLKTIGAAVGPSGSYLATGSILTAPFRSLIDSGIRIGYGSDGGSAAPLNPWLHIYFMVVGRNSAGELINAGQTLTRMQALRLYTIDNAWFSSDENNLGSIEPGKSADLAVLSQDFLDPTKVSDNSIKTIRSILTIVSGKIVYNAGTLSQKRSTCGGRQVKADRRKW